MTDEGHIELVKALVAARSAFPAIAKTRKAKIPTKSGGSYEYTYADLNDIMAAVQPALAANGLVLTYTSGIDGKMVAILATLSHVGGGCMEASVRLPVQGSTPQEMGSALTYGRRYSTEMVLGIVCQDDDDGNMAQQATVAHQSAPVVTDAVIEDWIKHLPESLSRVKVEKALDRARRDDGSITQADFERVVTAVDKHLAEQDEGKEEG